MSFWDLVNESKGLPLLNVLLSCYSDGPITLTTLGSCIQHESFSQIDELFHRIGVFMESDLFVRTSPVQHINTCPTKQTDSLHTVRTHLVT